ncbi:uncharacterized protein BJ171DRAFT_309617 [Polychytrium aggregatum]|uniref:uncharacterized protein n=1 Tax=Polychytrium aggregatum TaxID=110093 RepID=UPI0022FEC2D7|nr:uncharacterized protein BJ171DRAFT_309617 [Polychytrium aggregatum]KAI9206971.1 hypothetical protein BJ171DRAFT_309617 [Polychytrium aggregatum]
MKLRLLFGCRFVVRDADGAVTGPAASTRNRTTCIHRAWSLKWPRQSNPEDLRLGHWTLGHLDIWTFGHPASDYQHHSIAASQHRSIAASQRHVSMLPASKTRPCSFSACSPRRA